MKRIVLVALVACGGAVTASEPSSSGNPAPTPPPPGGGSSTSGSGGARGCTDIGCVDGFTVTLSAPSWKAGTYVFTITADTKTQTCKGMLPLRPCGAGRSLACTGDVAMIGESGCALAPSAHGFSDIRFMSSPAQVTISVERDGQVLAKQAFSPAYQTSQPNGPGCDPICKQASATLAVRAP